MEYAAHEFALDRPISSSSKVTKREHYMGLAKQGADVPELDGPELPEASEYLLEWFWQLHRSRSYHQGGPASISYSEVQAWADLTKHKLGSWEVDTLMKLDQLWIQTVYGN